VKPLAECTVGIAGLGLMGGAFALALSGLRNGGPALVCACDRDAEVLEAAGERGLIGKSFVSPKEMLPLCDFVLLCLNPSSLVEFAGKHMAFFKSGALVTDIAGVKQGVVELAGRFRGDCDFIPGHPMAGAETGGFTNAELVRFAGKNYILTPLERNKPENIAWLKDLIGRLGFARITETTAADHDDKIAFTSQLCHVIAASLIDCEADREITRYGGGSFEDLTRIAMLNAPMWTELFLENRENLLARIGRFEKSLAEIKALIAGRRAGELRARLDTVGERRGTMR
jgi:prephenate dehydrogenase